VYVLIKQIFTKKKGEIMRKLNVAEGSLVLMGFLFLLNVVVIKLKSVNLLGSLVDGSVGALLAANTCFILAFVFSIFGGSEDEE